MSVALLGPIPAARVGTAREATDDRLNHAGEALREIMSAPDKGIREEIQKDNRLARLYSSYKLSKRNRLSSEAGSEEPREEVVFRGSSVGPVVELGEIAIQALGMDVAVSSEREALQVRERDVDPGKERVGPVGVGIERHQHLGVAFLCRAAR